MTRYRISPGTRAYAVLVTMLIAVRKLGATRAELVKYATSADVTGERTEVVGYAGMIFE